MSDVDREALADLRTKVADAIIDATLAATEYTDRARLYGDAAIDHILASDWLAQVKATARAEALLSAPTEEAL